MFKVSKDFSSFSPVSLSPNNFADPIQAVGVCFITALK